MAKESPFQVVPPPIHTHYSDETQRSELCGRVRCPFGYIGITYKKLTPEEAYKENVPWAEWE